MGSRRLRITAGQIEVSGELNDTATADRLWEALPIEAAASTWGDEIYFRTQVQAEEESAREVVEMGDLGYWPPGQALCLFFGPTPASGEDEIRPASPVNVVGKMGGDPPTLKQVRAGQRVVVEKA